MPHPTRYMRSSSGTICNGWITPVGIGLCWFHWWAHPVGWMAGWTGFCYSCVYSIKLCSRLLPGLSRCRSLSTQGNCGGGGEVCTAMVCKFTGCAHAKTVMACAGWLNPYRFLKSACSFVPPSCGLSLSLFCNYASSQRVHAV